MMTESFKKYVEEKDCKTCNDCGLCAIIYEEEDYIIREE